MIGESTEELMQRLRDAAKMRMVLRPVSPREARAIEAYLEARGSSIKQFGHELIAAGARRDPSSMLLPWGER